MPLFPVCTVPRCKGRMLKTYTDKRLHTQLLYFSTLFDVNWSKTKIDADNKRRGPAEKTAAGGLSEQEEGLLAELKGVADAALGSSAFHTVDCKRLFSPATA